jgi:putative transposase
MRSLEEIIEHPREARELKRALAVKLSQNRVKNQNIIDYLQVSASVISKWCLLYEEQGAQALLLNYRGKENYLSADDKQEVTSFLRQQSPLSVEQLRDHLEAKYQVVSKSKPSYYQLLNEGGLRWSLIPV